MNTYGFIPLISCTFISHEVNKVNISLILIRICITSVFFLLSVHNNRENRENEIIPQTIIVSIKSIIIASLI